MWKNKFSAEEDEKIQTTLSTYSHLYPDQARKLADELDKLIESGEEE